MGKPTQPELVLSEVEVEGWLMVLRESDSLIVLRSRESRVHGEGVDKACAELVEVLCSLHRKHMPNIVELENMMQTSLQGIADKATRNKSHRFQNLIGMLSTQFLLWCWQFVNKNAAAGVDQQSATLFAQQLEINVENLVNKLKSRGYKAKLVLRTCAELVEVNISQKPMAS